MIQKFLKTFESSTNLFLHSVTCLEAFHYLQFIANVEWLVIANIGQFVMANEMKPSKNKLSSRTQCGDLLAMGLQATCNEIASLFQSSQ